MEHHGDRHRIFEQQTCHSVLHSIQRSLHCGDNDIWKILTVVIGCQVTTVENDCFFNEFSLGRTASFLVERIYFLQNIRTCSEIKSCSLVFHYILLYS